MEKPSMNEKIVLHREPENRRLGFKVKHAIKEWAMVSTAHGIPNIFRNERTFLKVVWMVCTLASASACFYLVALSVSAFLEYDVSNKISVVYQTPSEFPSVAICNQNLFVTNESLAFVQNVSTANNISDLTNFMTAPSSYSDIDALKFNIIFAKYVMELNAKNPELSDSFRKSLGLSLHDFVLSCFFANSECSDDDFVWYYDIVLGNCFKFNSGYYQNGTANQLKVTNKPGSLDGLQLTLYTAIPDDVRALAFSTGAHVIVYNNSRNPENYQGFDVAPGTNTNLVVSRQFTDQLPYPYNDCYDDIESSPFDLTLYERIKSSDQAYKQITCYDLCYQRFLIQTCGCYDMNYLTLDNTTKPCLSLDKIYCNMNAWMSFQKQDINSACGKYCPLECDSITYTLSMSFSDFPAPIFADQLAKLSSIQQKFPGQNVTRDLLKSSLLYLNVYYEENSYTTIEEQPSMTIGDLIANFGGTLGLFLGVSFLSFAEVFEILIEIAFLVYEHSRDKRNRVSDQVHLPPKYQESGEY